MPLNTLQTNMLGAMSAINGGPLAGFRNLVINGRMDFAQRGPGPFTAAGYTLDRWRIKQVGAGSTVAVAPSTIALDEFPKCLKADRTTTGSSGLIIEQPIEGVQYTTGKTVTVSFYASCANGVSLGVTLAQNFGTGGSAEVVTTTQNVVLTTTPTRYSFTFSVPTIAGKTVGTDHFLGLRFNVSQTQGNFSNLKITGVQAELGSVATPFEHRFTGLELMLCQRYFSKSYALDTAPGTVVDEGAIYVISNSNGYGHYSVRYPVVVRKSNPSLVAYSPVTGSTNSVHQINGSTDRTLSFFSGNAQGFSLGAGYTANSYIYFHYAVDAEL